MGEGGHGRALLSAPARGGKACAPQEADSELRAPEWGHQVVWGRGASGPELGLEGCVGHDWETRAQGSQSEGWRENGLRDHN